jgi:hypothetical protein
MVDLPESIAVHFDADDTDGMTQAIDAVTRRPLRDPSRVVETQLGRTVLSAIAKAL